jgi:hypothetical protein
MAPYAEATFDVWAFIEPPGQYGHGAVIDSNGLSATIYSGLFIGLNNSFPLSSGKVVIEVAVSTAGVGSEVEIGITDEKNSESWDLAGIAASSGSIMLAVDIDAGKIWYQIGDVWDSGDPELGTLPSDTFTAGMPIYLGLDLSPAASGYAKATLVTSITEMSQTPPAGFGEWKTTVTV